MRAFRPQLVWAISISSWLLAHSQKCDITLYSASCGMNFCNAAYKVQTPCSWTYKPPLMSCQ